MQDQAAMNRIWSNIVLEELVRFGVRHICIAPGSRSTPLTLEAADNRLLSVHTHFDERGLGFLALGMAKASRSPVAIVVTSGTAVANLLPAIAEAHLTGEKLVVLTADRPVDLIDCGANQAISQTGIYSNHVTDSLNLPSPSEQISPTWLLTSVDQLMVKQKQCGGAVHINCPFPEPLYSDSEPSEYDLAHHAYLANLERWRSTDQIYTQSVEASSSTIPLIEDLEQKQGLILVGKVNLEDATQAKQLATILGWPVLCDPQSGTSSEWQHYDLWMRNETTLKTLETCDCLVQFGARIVSKVLNAFIKQQCTKNNAGYYLISNEAKRLNPDHLMQTHIHTDITAWASEQINAIKTSDSSYFAWADALKVTSKQVNAIISQEIQGHLQQERPKITPEDKDITELNLAFSLPRIAGHYDLFIGNSLIVRLLDMVTSLKNNRTYSNRGASGIDGLVATAAGVQRIHQQPMLFVLGDTSLLYDLNSLALFREQTTSSVILVTNNDGGAIFDLLPIPKDKKRSLYQMPHGYQFEYAAKQFGLQYAQPNNMEDLIQLSSEHLKSGEGALLVEVVSEPEKASQDIKALIKAMHLALEQNVKH